jgi:small subunit ribosomal protein S20
MPHTKSAIKRLKQTEKRTKQNRRNIKLLKTQIRTFLEAVKVSDWAKADEELKTAFKKLDQAGAKRTIHPNKSARLKSRLSKRLATAKDAPPKPEPKKKGD